MARLDAHYETLRARHGYGEVGFGVGDISADLLARKFAASDGVDGSLDDDGTLVTTGVGMTGPPHLGTVGQLLTTARLQQAGADVQFVLADLEPYHGGRSLESVRELAERFRAFALDCGFDPEAGRLRTQEEARDVMHTAQLLAPYYDGSHWVETEPTEWEEAVRDAYEGVERSEASDAAGPTSEAARHHSGVLHLADFLHPLAHGYDRVVLALGIDEHGLTLATRNFLETVPDSLVSGTVGGLHARMVTGLGDAPKMGRSLPGSGIHLGMDPDRIRELLRSEDADGEDAETSFAFQAMCLASEYDAEKLDRIEAARRENGEAWEAAKAEYAEFVVGLAERWQAT